jgi:steroid delta-isomerase-like uncharacterized protein
MSEQEMKQLVKEYVKAINSHDNNAIEQFHAEDSVSVSAGDPGKTMGRAERRRYFLEREKAFPDARMTARNIKVDARGGTATFEWTTRGTHKGTFKGLAPTYKPVSNKGLTELKIKGGKITRETSHQDAASFVKLMASLAAGEKS